MSRRRFSKLTIFIALLISKRVHTFCLPDVPTHIQTNSGLVFYVALRINILERHETNGELQEASLKNTCI
jgi:hypothetical protein